MEQPKLRSTGKLGEFALVVGKLQEQYVQALLRGFEQQADAGRGQVVICSTNEDVGKQADVFLQLLDRGVGGVAYLAHGQNASLPCSAFAAARSSGCAVPSAGRGCPSSLGMGVVWGDRSKSGRSVSALWAPGPGPAMFVTCMSLASRQYEQSLRQAMENGGGSLPDEFTYYGKSWDDSLQEWLFAQQ